MPAELDWTDIAPQVLPAFPRRRPPAVGFGEPLHVLLPPGVVTGFGIDIGPAFLQVSESLVEQWAIPASDVAARALANLGELTARLRSSDLVRERIDGTEVRVLFSGLGWASALLLLPDELQRILGPEPQRLVAPTRDLLLSLPIDVDRGLAAWVNEEFGASDPNGIALEPFTFRDGALRCEPTAQIVLGRA
jgi:hypothetical protein